MIKGMEEFWVSAICFLILLGAHGVEDVMEKGIWGWHDPQ